MFNLIMYKQNRKCNTFISVYLCAVIVALRICLPCMFSLGLQPHPFATHSIGFFFSLSQCVSFSISVAFARQFSRVQRPRQSFLLQIPFEISINRATSLLFVGLQVVSCKFCKVDGAFRMAFHHLVCSIYGNIQPKCI